MKKIILYILFLNNFWIANSQKTNNFGIGISVGYKSPPVNTSLIQSLQIQNRIDLFLGG